MMAKSLAKIRDLLLPGIWARTPAADLICDYRRDAIDIVVDGVGTTEFLSRREIEGGNFTEIASRKIGKLLPGQTGEK